MPANHSNRRTVKRVISKATLNRNGPLGPNSATAEGRNVLHLMKGCQLQGSMTAPGSWKIKIKITLLVLGVDHANRQRVLIPSYQTQFQLERRSGPTLKRNPQVPCPGLGQAATAAARAAVGLCGVRKRVPGPTAGKVEMSGKKKRRGQGGQEFTDMHYG